MKKPALLLLAFASVGLVGCASLFYYPRTYTVINGTDYVLNVTFDGRLIDQALEPGSQVTFPIPLSGFYQGSYSDRHHVAVTTLGKGSGRVLSALHLVYAYSYQRVSHEAWRVVSPELRY